ncbi:energy-coupling factor transporter transmembrane protein EcfT [Corynebacterium sp. ES2794-CONJ1]|uniref:energy-coupling factor transporter transmembrane component T family protein n=1 Tax=unclassified Corynebacterium TaxID=2624378 RepID=UPI00216888BF|nr:MULTISPECIES: energy-coupling factor transporter transmembrane protein EcfT [unclassified Corynebacterium]MCS4489151.1 energy-coupling factor transporter transmembrane protein EcfT [Corynebacterium sp. ES2775-CONJ]MCS4490964.1 energy-coupling factor transporter transmembrane protein EcfT [Corynebacterium sp. ES2715-CONJ3]MCS4531154.1 energy-coupling factor transporter transmembrane protein EcfT [Corynebacterium sp. ES2730-CONJ]MCU9518522.1 energy-coupling factor transporter transmembrane pro
MIRSVPLGVYIDRDTVIHRLAPIWKFLFLFIFVVTTTIWVHSVYLALVLVGAGLALHALARIPLQVAWGQLWPALPVLIMLGLFQAWQLGIAEGARLVLVIFSALVLATLFTLTTRLEDLMDSLEFYLRPLARYGMNVDAIVLAISLTLRLIPVMLSTVNEVLDARKARGADFSVLAFGTPVIIRAIRRARGIADALWARGVGD